VLPSSRRSGAQPFALGRAEQSATPCLGRDRERAPLRSTKAVETPGLLLAHTKRCPYVGLADKPGQPQIACLLNGASPCANMTCCTWLREISEQRGSYVQGPSTKGHLTVRCSAGMPTTERLTKALPLTEKPCAMPLMRRGGNGQIVCTDICFSSICIHHFIRGQTRFVQL